MMQSQQLEKEIMARGGHEKGKLGML